MDKGGCEADIFKNPYLNFKIASTLSPLFYKKQLEDFWHFAKKYAFLDLRN